MKYLFTLITLLQLAFLSISGEKLPPDLFASNCIVGFISPDEIFPDLSEASLRNLKSLGFKIEYYYKINENPTLRKKEIEKCKQDIIEKKCNYKYTINIGFVFDPLSNSFDYVFAISKPDEKKLLLTEYCFMKMESTLEKLFKTINKKIPEPKDENFFISSKNSSYLPKVYKKFPEDLNKETIIFLEYENIPIDENTPSIFKRMYKKRNELGPNANDQLKEEALNYPFKYIISKRSEYKDSLKNTCRYVLESQLLKGYNNGENLYAGMNSTFTSDLYIRDLNTGDKYLLFDIYSNEAYYYKGIMRRFNKAVRQKYKL